MWLNELENSIIKLIFSKHLATWLKVTLKSVRIVSDKIQKKTERENEDKVINVSNADMYGYRNVEKR